MNILRMKRACEVNYKEIITRSDKFNSGLPIRRENCEEMNLRV